MQILNNPISALRESPKFTRHKGNRGRGTRWWRQILDRKWKYGCFAHGQWKVWNITLIYGRTAKIFASFRKSVSRNTMVTSDFVPEVTCQPYSCIEHWLEATEKSTRFTIEGGTPVVPQVKRTGLLTDRRMLLICCSELKQQGTVLETCVFIDASESV